MAGPCFTNDKTRNIKVETKDPAGKLLFQVIDKWFGSKIIQKGVGENPEAFKRFYEHELGLDFDLSPLPTLKEVQKLDRALETHIEGYQKAGKHTWLGKWFKLPEKILQNLPATKRFFKSVDDAGAEQRGNMNQITSQLNSIARHLEGASKLNGIYSKWGLSRKKAQKKLTDMEDTYSKLWQEKKYNIAEGFWNENLRDIISDVDLAATGNLYKLLVDPSLIFKQDGKLKSNAQLQFGNDLVSAAKIWHYGDAKWPSLKEQLWKVLGDGLASNLRVLKELERTKGLDKSSLRVEELQRLYDNYFDSKNPKVKGRIKDYFPRQVLDIAPTMARLSEDIHSGFLDKSYENQQKVGKYLELMIKDVSENLREPGHVRERAEEAPTRISKDVISIIDTYAKNTIRYNHNAFVTEATSKALKALGRLEGEKSDKHLKFLIDYVHDTHSAALGTNINNSKFKNISRALTSWQFISKLGLNIRGAARNSTQSLQHWVWYGHKAIGEAFATYKDPKMKALVNEAMGKQGFEFVNIQEISLPREILNNLTIDPVTHKVIDNTAHIPRLFQDYLDNVARITGWPMQKVENVVNRGVGFKLAFLDKWNYLSGEKGDFILRQYIKRSFKKPKDLTSEEYRVELHKKMEAEKIRRSTAAANDLVKIVHYLYDPFAKPKALRTPLGSVLGQFSVYSINFFEYQRSILAKGGRDLMLKEWDSPEAFRMYRLGMLYTMVTGLSAITNTAYNNLIENDTYERLSRLHQWIGGTAEEKEKAFYGRGPVTATLGGPTVSDILRIGSLFNFMNMNGNDAQSYMTGYQDFNNRTGKLDVTETLVRTINTQMGRLIYTSLPRMINGTSMPTVIGQELGLYKTPELQWIRDLAYGTMKDYAPKKVTKFFTPTKKKKKRSKSGNNTFSPTELEMILQAMDNLKK